MPDKYKILIADVPAGIHTLENILGGSAVLSTAVSMDQAREMLKKKVDLIICGIHFDESRMFDLLRLVKADPQSRHIPFLCFRDLDSELAPALFQSLEISCRALGAVGFVDLYDLKSKYGIEKADERWLPKQLVYTDFLESSNARTPALFNQFSSILN